MAAIYQSNLLKRADQVCDYIPLVSTVSNLVNLFQKYVVFPRLEQGQPLDASRFVYHAYLKDKSFLKCMLLAIPVIGTIFAFLFSSRNLQAAREIPSVQEVKGVLVKTNAAGTACTARYNFKTKKMVEK